MDGILICKICKEPIWNFICINCLAKNIRRILSEEPLKKFTDFHKKFLKHFHSKSDRFFHCLNCKLSNAPPICMDCYMYEVSSWFKNPDASIIKNIQKKFHFDFKKHEKIICGHVILPITENQNIERESGICDECGEYSDELILINGEWICPGCSEYKNR